MSDQTNPRTGSPPDSTRENAQPHSGSYVLTYAEPVGESDIRLADIWRILVRKKWVIVISTLLFGMAGAAAAFLMTPVYRAEVLLAPVPEQSGSSGLASLAGQLGGLAAIAGLNLESGSNRVEAIATLESRAFTEAFIRDRDLMPLLFADAWNENTGSWDAGSPEDQPGMWEAWQRFDSIRSVSEDLRTGLVTLAVDWADPELAADWANGLAGGVNKRLRGRAFDEAQSNLEFLRGQLEKTSTVEVREAVFGLIEAEMKNAMLANVRDEYAFRVIDPAVVPEERFKPKRRLLILAGLALGFLLGIISAVAAHSLGSRA